MKEKKTQSIRTAIGGQAVLEGVMMKSPEYTALAVRTSDGNIVTELKANKPAPPKGSFRTWPVVRGVFAFVDSLVEGMKITTRSAELAGEDFSAEEPSKFEKWLADKLGKSVMDIAIVIAVICAIGLSLGLFVLLPSFLVGLLPLKNVFLISLCEGFLRLFIFLCYLFAISRIKDIKRVFMYHGAEHKTIACYEAELELTPENAASCTRFHPRCGTNYMFLVMAIAILFFACIPVQGTLLRIATRLAFIPVVAGISYEVLKAAAKSDNTICRIVRAPGLALQKLTTIEPDASMLEVAIVAFKLAKDGKDTEEQDNTAESTPVADTEETP